MLIILREADFISPELWKHLILTPLGIEEPATEVELHVDKGVVVEVAGKLATVETEMREV